jgi:hypothetical protein
LLLAALCGCGTLGGAKSVVTVDQDQEIVVRQAPETGTYALYSAHDRAPILTVKVLKNEDIGFRKTPSGQLVAVAGDAEVPLTAGRSYSWNRL